VKNVSFNQILTVTLLTLVSNFAYGQNEPTDLDLARDAVGNARSTIQQLYGAGLIVFKQSQDELAFVKAMAQLQTVEEKLSLSKQEQITNEKVDAVLEEARFVQKALGSYLGEKQFFGYLLKHGKISIQIEADGVYERIVRRIPFLAKYRVGGEVQINENDQEIISGFNALKTEFYGLLVEAAHLNPADGRIRNLANWGTETKVAYGKDDFYAVEILTYSQVWDLNLKR